MAESRDWILIPDMCLATQRGFEGGLQTAAPDASFDSMRSLLDMKQFFDTSLFIFAWPLSLRGIFARGSTGHTAAAPDACRADQDQDGGQVSFVGARAVTVPIRRSSPCSASRKMIYYPEEKQQQQIRASATKGQLALRRRRWTRHLAALSCALKKNPPRILLHRHAPAQDKLPSPPLMPRLSAQILRISRPSRPRVDKSKSGTPMLSRRHWQSR